MKREEAREFYLLAKKLDPENEAIEKLVARAERDRRMLRMLIVLLVNSLPFFSK